MRFLFFLFWIFFGCNAFANKEDILFQEGLYHYQKGRYDLAIKAFSSVIDICPLYPKIEEMLISSIKKRAESLKTENKTKKEISKMEEKDKPKPLEYEPYYDILALPEKETKTLTHHENNYLFGRKLISIGMNEEGIAYLEAILKEKPKIGFADKILFTIGEAKRDEEIINKLLKEYPKTALKYEAKLLLCNLSKDYKKAIVGFMDLIKELSSNGTLTDLFPHLPPFVRNVDEIMVECQMGIGNSYKELGDYSKSIVEYKKIVDEYPKMKGASDALFYIADMYDRYPKVRDFLKAVECYGRLIREYPDSKWIERAKTRKKHIEENYL